MLASATRTIRILVLELLHADEAAYQAASKSMRREGQAMLLSMAIDLNQWPCSDVTVAAISQAINQLGELDSLVTWNPCQDVSSLVAEVAAVKNHFDVAFCIAPEGALQKTIDCVKQIASRVLCVNDRLVQLGSDKLAFHDWCCMNQIPMIPVLPVADCGSWPVNEGDFVVVKDRFGAGCEGIRRYVWSEGIRQVVEATCDQQMIWQQFMSGKFYSVGILGTGQGTDPLILPAAEQDVCWEGCVPRYQGGRVPAVFSALQQCQLTDLVRQVVSAARIDDGYVGLDLMWSAEIGDIDQCHGDDDRGNSSWRVVELNPRLCTSYLGYRRLFSENLTECWWNPSFVLSDVTGEKPCEFLATGF